MLGVGSHKIQKDTQSISNVITLYILIYYFMNQSSLHNKDNNKLVFVHSYFYPDNSAGSQMLSDLSFCLHSNSFDVSVIASRKMRYDYDNSLLNQEIINGVHVYRVWSSNLGRNRNIYRVFDYVTLEISLIIKIFQIVKAGDIVILLSEPPLLNIFAYPFIRFKKGVVTNWVHDLFPEVAVSAGLFSKKSLINRLIIKLRNYVFKSADQNIVIGNRMFDYLVNIGESYKNITKIENWSDGRAIHPVTHNDNHLRKEWGLEGKFVIGYSGNLGRAHDISTILAVIWKLRFNTNILFLFIGDGVGLNRIKKYVNEKNLNNVVFKPFQNRDLLSMSLCVPDIHWLTLNPNMEGFVVPSKFYGILAASKPAIFIGDTDGEIARDIKRINCGNSFEIGDIDKLESFILQCADDPKYVAKIGKIGHQKFGELYDFPVAVGKFIKLFKEL
jgi:colanic acid biosynthesis glycosyl transferase WcaI